MVKWLGVPSSGTYQANSFSSSSVDEKEFSALNKTMNQSARFWAILESLTGVAHEESSRRTNFAENITRGIIRICALRYLRRNWSTRIHPYDRPSVWRARNLHHSEMPILWATLHQPPTNSELDRLALQQLLQRINGLIGIANSIHLRAYEEKHFP